MSSESKRSLDPMERSMEALFGLIMVLTFTGSLSILSTGEQEVKEMLIGALGCNLAWGVIDACFYLMGVMSQRGRGRQLRVQLRRTNNPAAFRDILSEAIPEVVVDLMTPDQREALCTRITSLPKERFPPLITWSDLKGAVGVFLWVFLVTFPVAVPFIFIHDAPTALRVSNGIAIALLGVIGWRLAAYAGFNKWITIVSMVLFGSIMVAITIALGG